jgi:hypothetical protein
MAEFAHAGVPRETARPLREAMAVPEASGTRNEE